ncbi:MAG: NAD+ synthase [Acidobacteriota bacterium]|jgi:NAD+ synthetase|nr:NAD+ synthase [Acidobacteriota bacterium]
MYFEKMKIALAQINTTVGDIVGNRDLILQTMARARGLGAELAVFPELSLTGYPPKDLLLLHGFVEANLRALEEIAARISEMDGMGAIVGFVDKNPKKDGRPFHNAAAFLSDGKIQAIVHKTLLPTYDVFDEDRYFGKGIHAPLVDFKGRKIGISICEDAWNSGEFWDRHLYDTDPIRSLVEKGANLLVNISASPFELGKPRFRFDMLRDHAVRHRVPLVYVNLVGGNDDLVFDGNSLAIGGDGGLLAQGGSCADDLVIVDFDTDSDADSNTDSGAGSNLEYQTGEKLDNLFQALVLGVRDYARKCRFRSAVLGLSGGIDSAVVACIASAALGAENVTGVSMPSMYSAPESYADARALAENLGIRFEVIPIRPTYEAFTNALAPTFAGCEPDVTEENLQARIRGTLLMALSNKFGHLVLSTGNKSEMAAGYCTLYGDMVGGLAVISDVPKTLVYKLAAHINREREIIPHNTLVRPPSAELRPDQTDQDTLPDYDTLDGIVQACVEEQLGAGEIVARGYDKATVDKVLRMVFVNEYKRRQAAPGLKVTTRAFGSGRRMPIAMKMGC